MNFKKPLLVDIASYYMTHIKWNKVARGSVWHSGKTAHWQIAVLNVISMTHLRIIFGRFFRQKCCWPGIKLHITAHITFYFNESCSILSTEVRLDQKDFWIEWIVIQSWFRDVDIVDRIVISQWPDFSWARKYKPIISKV